MYRLLSEILDNPFVSKQVYFKGGIATMMLGWLDRFSVDLDFDLKKNTEKIINKKLKNIFKILFYYK